MTSAFAATAGYRWTRLTEVSPLLRPSCSTAGPSDEANASLTWSGLNHRAVRRFLPPELAEFAAIEGEHRVQAGGHAGLQVPAERGIAAGHFPVAHHAHAALFRHRQRGIWAQPRYPAPPPRWLDSRWRPAVPLPDLAAAMTRPDPLALTLTLGPICMAVNESDLPPLENPSRPCWAG